MKASEKQQADLLSLANLDLEIKRTKINIAELSSGESLAALAEAQRSVAAKLIDARNDVDSIELELKRAEEDLNLVEQRIAKDEQRLNQTSSPKDAQGIQAELVTLTRRKSELEDLELAVLERKEEIEAAYKTVLGDKQSIDEELSAQQNSAEAQILKLRSGLDLISQQRAQQAALLPAELVELYEKKAARSVAVGKLNNRECGACRISIGATALAEIHALPADEIATCPECQAILVR